MTNELKSTLKVDTTDFEQRLRRARETLKDTQEGMKDTQDSADSMGDSVGSLADRFRKASQRWRDASSGMKKGSESGVKGFKALKAAGVLAIAAVAVEVGQKLADAFKQVAEVAKESARMFDPQSYAKSTTAMEKSIRRMKTTLGSFTAPVVNAIQGAIAKIVDGITWVLEKIRVTFSFISGLLTSIVQPIVSALSTVVQWLKNAINSLAGMLGLGTVFKQTSDSAKKAADSMEAVSESVSAGLASFDKLNTLSISNMGDAEQSEELVENMEVANDLGTSIGEKIKETLGRIPEILGEIDLGEMWEDFKGGASEAWASVTSWAAETWEGVKTTAIGVWDTVSGKVTAVWQGFVSWANSSWEWVKTKAYEIWTNITGTVVTKFNEARAIINVVFTSLWRGIKSAWDTVYNAIKGAIDWILSKVEWIMGKVQAAKNAVSSIGGGIVSGAKSLGSGIASGFNDLVSKGKNLLGLASGGAIAPNNPQPYILGDNTREYEVVSPVSLMKQAVKQAMNETTAGGSANASAPIDITLNIDGKKLVRMTYDQMETERRRRNGVTL